MDSDKFIDEVTRNHGCKAKDLPPEWRCFTMAEVECIVSAVILKMEIANVLPVTGAATTENSLKEIAMREKTKMKGDNYGCR